MALEKQVSRIPELEARITALEKEKVREAQATQAVTERNVLGIQDVASLWRGVAATTTSNATRSPASEVNMETSNPAYVLSF